MADPLRSGTVRVTDLLKNRSWLALAPAAALTFALAFWGFGRIDGTLGGFERLEKSVQLLKGQGAFAYPKDPWQLVAAQWLMPLIAVVTAAKLFLRSLRRDLRLVFAKRSRDHVIVCGVGDTGRRIVELLRAAGERVLAVDLDAEGPGAKAVESLGAPTIPGDAKTAAVLELAGVRRARMLVSCTGDDTANLEIALLAAERREAGGPFGVRLAVVPEMRADWLFEHFLSRTSATLGSDRAEIRILNAADRAARLLCRVPALAGTMALRPARTEVAILGFGDMGRAIATQLLRTASALPGRRLRLLVFDGDAAAAAACFAALHPGVAGVADIVATDARIVAGRTGRWDAIADGSAASRLAAVVVCLPAEGEALYAATRIRQLLDRAGEAATPVLVRVASRRKLAETIALSDAPGWSGERFIPFGDLGELLGAGIGEDSSDTLARACHEAYLDTLKQESDAPSARPWAALPELYRRSNQLFADHLEVKLRAAGLRSCPAADPRLLALAPAELESLAASEHWRWLVERRLAGWTYGATRDDAVLRHPLLRPWDELPEEARDGVRAIVARIPEILRRVGREIRRERLVRGDAAAEVLDAFDPATGEHLVLALDPAAPAARTLALRVAALPHATIRCQPAATGAASAGGLGRADIASLRERLDGVCDP